MKISEQDWLQIHTLINCNPSKQLYPPNELNPFTFFEKTSRQTKKVDEKLVTQLHI